MKQLHSAFEYLKHKVLSKPYDAIPKLNDLGVLLSALQSDRTSYAMLAYDDVMDDLLYDETEITVVDKGAGSRKMGDIRKLSDIAKYAVLNEDDAVFLSRLVYFLKPKHILELGTSLGVSTLCMALSCPESQIHSVDACPETHAVASNVLHAFSADNVSLHTTTFKAFLAQNEASWDFVYVDGDHRYQQTLDLMNDIQNRLSEEAVILLDDIHWSKGMTKAWRKLAHDKDFIALDFYHFGLLLPKNKGFFTRVRV